MSLPIAFRWLGIAQSDRNGAGRVFSPANPRLDGKVCKGWSGLHDPHQPTGNAGNGTRPPGVGVSPTAPCFSCHGRICTVKTVGQLATPDPPDEIRTRVEQQHIRSLIAVTGKLVAAS